MTTDDRRAGGPTGQVKSLVTAVRILEAIDALPEPTLTALTDEVGFAKSTVFDHLQTLEANDFVVREDGVYRLGLRFLEFGGTARNDIELYETAQPEVEKLAVETGELVNLVVEEHGKGVYIDFVKGADSVELDTYVGKREPLHNTAFGKAILAHLPEERVTEIVERHGLPRETESTITTREDLDERLEQIRSRGFALDREERLEDLSCVAAPIIGSESGVIGAVSISGPAGRMHDKGLADDLADKVVRTANIIKVNLTYS